MFIHKKDAFQLFKMEFLIFPRARSVTSERDMRVAFNAIFQRNESHRDR